MFKTDRIYRFGLYLIFFLPLLFVPFTFFPWHYGKTVIFQILVEILAVLFLLARFSCHPFDKLRAGSERSEGSFTFWKHLNLLDYSILFFLLVITLTSFTGANPSNSFWGNQARANGVFTWWHFGAFYFLLKCLFGQWKESSDKFSLVAVIVSVLVSFTALFPKILPLSWQSEAGGGIIGNRAFLASYLVLAIGLCLYLFFTFKNKWRYLFIGAALIDLVALYLTSNRGSLVGLVVGILAGLVISIIIVSKKKNRIINCCLLLAVGISLFALFFLRSNQAFLSVFPKISSLTDFSFSSGTAATRLMAWQAGWQGLKDKPLFGWGLGNYEIIFNKYYNPQFLEHGFTETVWDKPHNWLLEIGVTAGILGVIGCLAILFFAGFYLLRNCWSLDSRFRGNDIGRMVCTGRIILFSALVAYFIANLFLFETTNSLLLWFLILAIVSTSAASGCHPRESDDPVGNEGIDLLGSRFRGNDKMRRFFVLLAILPISYLLFLNFCSLKSSYYMRQAELSNALIEWTGFANRVLAIKVPFLSENAVFLAEQLTKFDKAGAIVKEKKVEDAALKIAGILEVSSSKYPDNLSFPVWAGQVYLVLGEKFDERYYQQVEENLLKAEKISPNKQEVLFLLGRLYLLTKDFNKAIDFQKKAVVAAPEINTSHWFLGLTYAAQGERAKGLEEIEKAMELGYNLTKEQKLYVLDLYALERDYSRLIEEYNKLIDEEPSNLNWYIKLAVVYAESGDKKSALETVRYAVGLFSPLKAEAEKFIKQYKLE